MALPTFSDYEIEQQVLAFMAQLGVSPAHGVTLLLDGQLHRYTIEGGRER